MVKLQMENKKIEEKMRNIARDLLKEKQVDLIIGYSQGTIPLSSAPIFIRNEDEVHKLIWNNLCYVNLAKYLIPNIKTNNEGELIDLKVGIVSKGCVARSIIHLMVEHQINKENIIIIGINCNGNLNRRRIEKELGPHEVSETCLLDDYFIVKGEKFEKKFKFDDYMNDLCKHCKIRAPPLSDSLIDIIVGESQEVDSLDDQFEDIIDFEKKSPDERWNYMNELLKDCTRCYACREACPLCYCNLCFVDQNLPTWFGKTSELSDILIFHMVRGLHLAGRCVECGACSSVCPMGIDLSLINRKINKIVKDRFDFVSGLSLEKLSPMMTYKMDDKQEFMLEED
ncbi:MAG: 4Fe-4S ferredoxin [Promethearchaeota archaeon]|nr:MAG: 4Fe-4S ferredoxin [Candidatus Lokiarchaeota archaeon]